MPQLSFDAFSRPSDSHYEAIAAYLRHMLDLAEGYGGQSISAQNILLSIYSPSDYKMSGADLTGLDIPHIHEAICLLHEHGMCRKDVFSLVEGSETRVLQLAKPAPQRP